MGKGKEVAGKMMPAIRGDGDVLMQRFVSKVSQAKRAKE